MRRDNDNERTTDSAGAPSSAFELRFLGTGAADHDWARLGASDVRGSAGTLFGGRVLIDAGVTGLENLTRFGVDPAGLRAIVITHSHDDHFKPAVIAKILDLRGDGAERIDIYCTPQALEQLDAVLPAGMFQGHAIRSGDRFTVDEMRFTALPANHALKDFSEEAFHYLIETPYGNILYALDGAWLTRRERLLIGDRQLRLIVWDATMEKAGDWRCFEHNDLAMIDLMMLSLRGTETVDEKTICVLNHIARTLWPEDAAEAEALAAAHGYLLAHDGMRLELKSVRDGGRK